ncbi:MAG: HAD family phosphatase [Vicingaceae bacterium]|nr:HAD family phosphatase [Vicingaceae bacterium]
MELKGIKNIIFDLGGVLLNLDFNLTQQAFVELGVTDFKGYYNKAKQVGLFDDFEIGKISEAEFCAQIKVVSGIDKSNEDLITAWNAMLLNFPDVRKELLLRLKDDFSIVLLSNTNETHVRSFLKTVKKDIDETSLSPLFKNVYYSNEIGFRKPNANVFQFVLDQNNFKAEETLFLDDSIQHLEGAKQLGIKTFHINDKPVEELFANFLA